MCKMKTAVQILIVAFIGVACMMSCKKDSKGTDSKETLELGVISQEFITKNLVEPNLLKEFDLYSTYNVSWESPNNIKTTLFNKGWFPALNEWATTQKFAGFGIFDIDGICSVGKVWGLGAITEIPTSGYTNTVICEVGCGYVIRYSDAPFDFDFYTSHMLTYARMYVVEQIVNTSNEVIGAKVKYQYPFELAPPLNK